MISVEKVKALQGVDLLLPYQQEWIRDKSPVKVIEKSRRTGITWAEAGDDALEAASAAGTDVWYIGYNQSMALEYIEAVADWARAFNQAAEAVEEIVLKDEDRDINAYRVRFASGFKITALTSRPKNLRGKSGRVVIDEAAFHDDLPELIKAAMALIMWGGDVRIISTHDGDENPFNELVKDIRAGKLNYSLHRVDLDEALSDGLYQRICLVRGIEWTPEGEAEWREALVKRYGDGADEELFCIPTRSGGVYFSRMLIESCMSRDIAVKRYTCPEGFELESDERRTATVDAWLNEAIAPLLNDMNPDQDSWFGEDFARSGDLTVLMPAQETPEGIAVTFALELRNVPFRQQEQILFYILDRMPRFRGGAFDARGNGQFLAEVAMQRYGIARILQVMLSREWYRENMPRYKSAFEDRTIRMPYDADIIEDHRAVRMEGGVPRIPDAGRKRGTDGAKRHGDSAVAGAMLIHAAHAIESVPPDYESGGKREAAFAGRGAW